MTFQLTTVAKGDHLVAKEAVSAAVEVEEAEEDMEVVEVLEEAVVLEVEVEKEVVLAAVKVAVLVAKVVATADMEVVTLAAVDMEVMEAVTRAAVAMEDMVEASVRLKLPVLHQLEHMDDKLYEKVDLNCILFMSCTVVLKLLNKKIIFSYTQIMNY